tara:strand:+ start:983 stop:1312 length:330 start_codon:yes stop_codon:yes gene_type:complete
MNKTESSFAVDAIYKIKANPQCTIAETYESLTWFENNTETKPTKSEFDEALKTVKAEYNAQAYARNRKAEYPDWGTQLNKIYDDGLTKWKSEMIDPVKAKWPKDNSGPK